MYIRVPNPSPKSESQILVPNPSPKCISSASQMYISVPNPSPCQSGLLLRPTDDSDGLRPPPCQRADAVRRSQRQAVPRQSDDIAALSESVLPGPVRGDRPGSHAGGRASAASLAQPAQERPQAPAAERSPGPGVCGAAAEHGPATRRLRLPGPGSARSTGASASEAWGQNLAPPGPESLAPADRRCRRTHAACPRTGRCAGAAAPSTAIRARFPSRH